jgi:methionyl-tRNA formyltransferase
MSIRTVFMGSPEFSLPALQGLAKQFPLVGVVTQPDRPAGRGRVLTPPPVKLLARQLGIPVIQPRRMREPQAMQQLQDWDPELIVVAAFGQILRAEVLDLPRFGCVNVHASLLPRWRGAAPIPAAILHDDAETGVTIMLMDPGVDTGPMLSQRALPIRPDDTAGALSERLSVLGGELLLETLPSYLSGELQPIPQDDSAATYAPMLKKEDGRLDFSLPAAELERQVRAFNPWPGTFLEWQGQPLKIHRARAVRSNVMAGRFWNAPGTRETYEDRPAVGTSQGLLVLDLVQPAGKRPIPGSEFLRGARAWEGNVPG